MCALDHNRIASVSPHRRSRAPLIMEFLRRFNADEKRMLLCSGLGSGENAGDVNDGWLGRFSSPLPLFLLFHDDVYTVISATGHPTFSFSPTSLCIFHARGSVRILGARR